MVKPIETKKVTNKLTRTSGITIDEVLDCLNSLVADIGNGGGEVEIALGMNNSYTFKVDIPEAPPVP